MGGIRNRYVLMTAIPNLKLLSVINFSMLLSSGMKVVVLSKKETHMKRSVKRLTMTPRLLRNT